MGASPLKCFLLGLALTQMQTTTSASHSFRITPRIGTAAGFTSCGGIGKVEDWRLQGCAGKINPCVIPANVKLAGQIDFVTGDNAKEMGYQYFVHRSDDKDSADVKIPFIERSVDTSGLEKGVPYTLLRYGLVPTKFQGKIITAKVVLFHKSDNKTEICATVNYQIRP